MEIGKREPPIRGADARRRVAVSDILTVVYLLRRVEEQQLLDCLSLDIREGIVGEIGRVIGHWDGDWRLSMDWLWVYIRMLD
jgi:hypothetical protein